jgi:hypothetical protein
LASFIDHARKTGREQAARPGRSSAAGRASAKVRSWAREHNIEISERGRIPASIIRQYETAKSSN